MRLYPKALPALHEGEGLSTISDDGMRRHFLTLGAGGDSNGPINEETSYRIKFTAHDCYKEQAGWWAIYGGALGVSPFAPREEKPIMFLLATESDEKRVPLLKDVSTH